MAAVPQQRRGNTSISTLQYWFYLYFLSCFTVTLILSYVRSAGLTEADQSYKEKTALLKALLGLMFVKVNSGHSQDETMILETRHHKYIHTVVVCAFRLG